jgi:hypothetical protein
MTQRRWETWRSSSRVVLLCVPSPCCAPDIRAAFDSAAASPALSHALINGLRLPVPPVLEGIVPVSPSAEDFPYEVHSLLALEALVQPDSVVYDDGARAGLDFLRGKGIVVDERVGPR